ncbi:hypothetical protein BDV11DRAFT_191094 [Aspergillus similis]
MRQLQCGMCDYVKGDNSFCSVTAVSCLISESAHYKYDLGMPVVRRRRLGPRSHRCEKGKPESIHPAAKQPESKSLLRVSIQKLAVSLS